MIHEEMLGQRYGQFTVLEYNLDASNKTRKDCYTVQCICGTRKVIAGIWLRNGHCKSCGCTRRASIGAIGRARRISLTGQRFGRLVAGPVVNGKQQCTCDCGTITLVDPANLRYGRTMSCGCLQREDRAIRLRDLNKKNCGENSPSYVLGLRADEFKFNEAIRQRDGYSCQDCHKTQAQELIELHRRLSVHHLNGDHCDDRLENAITLCASCHGRRHERCTGQLIRC